MGTTGGGVFKTTDGGDNWAPVTDRYFGGTIGAIAVAESNPDIVYVGGGEFPIRGNTSHGDGVYKTTDGGRTWSYLGLVETRHISKSRSASTRVMDTFMWQHAEHPRLQATCGDARAEAASTSL